MGPICQKYNSRLAVDRVVAIIIRDGNRTEPEPNASNSNPCFLQKRTEPNELKLTEPNRTELRDLPNRTEPELHHGFGPY